MKIPVRIDQAENTPAEIVSQLRKLDAETFRNIVKIAKKIRRGDRIVAAAEKEINDK